MVSTLTNELFIYKKIRLKKFYFLKTTDNNQLKKGPNLLGLFLV